MLTETIASPDPPDAGLDPGPGGRGGPDPFFEGRAHLRNTRGLDLSAWDWDLAARHPVTADELRVLTYMADVEGQTLLYMRDLLTDAAIRDPEISLFLPIWAYEETHHSLALQRFLLAMGVDLGRDRLARVRGRASAGEAFERWAGAAVAWVTPGFLAVHMAWGAINERTAVEAYAALARRTRNPVLAPLLERIIKDERRHYAFYRGQARSRLADSVWTRRLTRRVLSAVWSPVGAGVSDPADVRFAFDLLFGDAAGRAAARQIDDDVEASLPGLEGLRLMSRAAGLVGRGADVPPGGADDRRLAAAGIPAPPPA